MNKLTHENVVRFLAYSVKPSAIVFELCEVKASDDTLVHNVAELIDLFNENEYFNLKERLDIVLQSAKGLSYLHNNSIIHKDFKPNNCLVTGDLDNIKVKVADFDDIFDIKNTVTSTLTSNCNQKKQGITLAYSAPDLLLENKTPSVESDVYSFAISTYAILGNVDGMPW
ncbi:serine/threonine-protein kinase B-raf-like [Clytia hemisphaerica]|uniref:serine/threonine-protein kinase B-raf-like n=1 Tax=Clytia hemisphaerica TaxID=252671 RepID=UPI0034D7389B